MAATFYTEPVLTLDLDIFVLLSPGVSNLISLEPIYQALRVRGYTEEEACIVIEGVPVQFLPAYNSLIEEALAEARETDYEGVRTRVVRAEHLVAICLQTGRPKDRARVALLREQSDLDLKFLADVLRRYSLEEKWTSWRD